MTEIMISLVAVVLLILVIGFFAMRFLRADDSDDFDDLPAERTRSRSTADDQEFDGAGRVVPLAGRSARGGRGHGGADLPARQPEAPARGRTSRRDLRPADPHAESARHEDGRPARGRTSREYPGRPVPAGEQALDDRSYGDRRFSSHPQADDRRPGDRGSRDRSSSQRPAAPAGAPGAWGLSDAESTQMLGADRRADRGDRSDRGRSQPDPREQRRPAAARTGRASGGSASGKDWDSLSDVDYWAELASDKPLTGTAQPAGRDRLEPAAPAAALAAATSRSDRRSRSGRADLGDVPDMRGETAVAGDVTAVLPSRRHASAGPAAGSALPGGESASRGDRGVLAGPAERASTPAWDGATGRAAPAGSGSRRQRDRSAAPRQDGGMAALARLGGPASGDSRPPVADDDPLTSPSFPAIRNDDSRSYRTRQSASAPGEPGGYPETGPQAAVAAGPDYAGRAPDRAPARGRRARQDDRPASTGSGSYPPAYPAPAPPAPAAGYRDYASPPATPAGNPYGSYVSPSAPAPAAGRQDGDAYGGYPASPETQHYSQPSGPYLPPAPAAPGRQDRSHPATHAASDVVPIHAAPVPAAPDPDSGGYGSRYGTAAGSYGQPAADAYPSGGHAGSGYPGGGAGGGYPSGGYPEDAYPGSGYADAGGGYPDTSFPADGYPAAGPGRADYPAAAYSGSHYDQSANLPADPPDGQQDQNGYGTPDSGYGAGAYGGYPGY